MAPGSKQLTGIYPTSLGRRTQCHRLKIPAAGNGTAKAQQRSTMDMRNLLTGGDYRRARDSHTGVSTAYGPGPWRANGYWPKRLSARRVRPFLSDVRCAGCVSQSLRAQRCTLANNMADDDPIGRYGAPRGLAAITVVRRARLNTVPMGEACLDRRPAHHACRTWLGASERISSAPRL
jgi:hypothetical protein